MPPVKFIAPMKYVYVHILQLRYHPRSFIACLKIISFSNPFCQLCQKMKPLKQNGYRRKAFINFLEIIMRLYIEKSARKQLINHYTHLI